MAVDAAVAGTRLTVAELVSRLEAGVREVQGGEGWRAYLAAMSRFHQYSAGNLWLILAQMPAATRACGFHGWLRLGRHVKKGEHGVKILAPVAVRRSDREDAEDEPQTVTRFRVVTVFDISQTEGDPLPEHPCQALTTASERGAWLYGRLMEVARTHGVQVREGMSGLGRAHGVFVPGANTIGLAPGLSTDQAAKTLCHELAHALLHAHGDRPREEQEAEAEGVAFVVTAWAGLDTSAYSFAYVADWAGRKDGAALIRRVGSTIHKTAASIIDRIAPTETSQSA